MLRQLQREGEGDPDKGGAEVDDATAANELAHRREDRRHANRFLKGWGGLLLL